MMPDDRTAELLKEVLTLAHKCIETAPVTILGSGASMSHGIRGMGGLAEYLLKEIDPNDTERPSWNTFAQTLTQTRDLERALQQVQLPDSLLAKVIHNTRSMIISDDLSLFDSLIARTTHLPLTDLFTHFFRSTHRSIDVVTTNYDRVAEYAAEFASYEFFDGFTNRHFRRFRGAVPVNSTVRTRERCVNIWKVHGSIDWFRDQRNVPIALPHSINYPEHCKPLLVTPGITKYFETHLEPFRSIMTNADLALANARGFICIGYGFADSHIEPKLIERVASTQAPVAILARTLREGAKNFLATRMHERMLALEQNGEGTTIYTSRHHDGVLIPDCDLWSLSGFLSLLHIPKVN